MGEQSGHDVRSGSWPSERYVLDRYLTGRCIRPVSFPLAALSGGETWRVYRNTSQRPFSMDLGKFARSVLLKLIEQLKKVLTARLFKVWKRHE